jgi:hypothetical protein
VHDSHGHSRRIEKGKSVIQRKRFYQGLRMLARRLTRKSVITKKILNHHGLPAAT